MAVDTARNILVLKLRIVGKHGPRMVLGSPYGHPGAVEDRWHAMETVAVRAGGGLVGFRSMALLLCLLLYG